jgi:hypothetical protein
VLDAVLARCCMEKLASRFAIPAFEDTGAFLTLLAVKRQKFASVGGELEPDYRGVAVSVLDDFNSGKVQFFSEAPDAPSSKVLAAVAEPEPVSCCCCCCCCCCCRRCRCCCCCCCCCCCFT